MKNDMPLVRPLGLQPLSQDVLLQKYAAPGETSAQEIQHRVAVSLADDALQQERFEQVLNSGFYPGGRINSAAGRDRVSTMINCFVQPVMDSMTEKVNGLPGIMGALTQSAATMRLGGGVGYDFSRIRPRGAIVKGTGSDASGPLSYMRVYDRMCQTVMSAGSRRGAQMGVLRVDHPDVLEFIDAKKAPDATSMGLSKTDAGRLSAILQSNNGFGYSYREAFSALSNFNISVAVTDEFMNAVVNDGDFDLVHAEPPKNAALNTKVDDNGVTQYVYRTVKAREIWERIMRNTYEGAEPGVLFIDRINKDNNLSYCERIEATNPCGEVPLPAYGCCCLGSHNLAKFVSDPFSPLASFDMEGFKKAVAASVELLDKVLDKTRWPLPEQANEAANKRRIGMGFLALADAMAMLGIRYDSDAGVAFADGVSEAMRDAAYEASIELAKRLGSFPFFDAEKYLAPGSFASRLPEHIQAKIRMYGIRNSHLLAIAPAGTISLAFGDNASSGIEPIFAKVSSRVVLQADGSRKEYTDITNGAYRLFRHLHGDKASDVFVTAQEMTVADHLRVLGAVAKHIDSAISKTVNVPVDYPYHDFQQVYMNAWKMGLKGITTYRPNSTTGAVLVATDNTSPEDDPAATQDLRADEPDRRVVLKEVQNITDTLRWPNRPEVDAEGITYQVKHTRGNFAVTVNHVTNGRLHPLEVYVGGNEQPRGLAAIAKALSVDMRTDDGKWLALKLDSLMDTEGDDGFEMLDRASGKVVRMPSLAAGFASIVKHRLDQIGVFSDSDAASPMVNALLSRREPKTGPKGAIGWGADIDNPATGDNFHMFVKELRLPNGQIRPYSVWLSGKYPRVLEGLMKVLSIDLRISDPAWAAMKLRKLTTFGEVRGDFMAQIPGSQKQQNYPSTVAYMATLLLARMQALGLINDATRMTQAIEPAAILEASPVRLSGLQCPACKTMSWHRRSGCHVCDHCGHEGSCG